MTIACIVTPYKKITKCLINVPTVFLLPAFENKKGIYFRYHCWLNFSVNVKQELE